jgi:hypothetical protein
MSTTRRSPDDGSAAKHTQAWREKRNPIE